MGTHSGIHDRIIAAPVGCCIYCGQAEGLTDEHIIPYGLGGSFILPKSSCKQCAAITSAFERRVLRGFMYESRVAGGLPTRRKQKMPKTLPLIVERNGAQEQVDVPAREYPAMMLLPIFTTMGISQGGSPSRGVSFSGIQTLYIGRNPIGAMVEQRATAMKRKVTNWDISAFARLLAKIAYGFAVADLGLFPREEVPILPLILGEADDASFWLGSSQYTLSVDSMQPKHSLGLMWLPDPVRKGEKMLVARVKLFATHDTYGYEIVVWRPTRDYPYESASITAKQ